MAEIKMVLHEITLAKAMVWNTITGHPSTRSETRGKTNEFEGATCTACDSPLNRKGFCTNRRCGYSTCYQDEPGGWLRNQQQVRVHALAKFEDGCVVANTKSGRYHRPDAPAYRRAKKARHVIFFESESDAQTASYRRVAP